MTVAYPSGVFCHVYTYDVIHSEKLIACFVSIRGMGTIGYLPVFQLRHRVCRITITQQCLHIWVFVLGLCLHYFAKIL
jgi:hypothetical protein